MLLACLDLCSEQIVDALVVTCGCLAPVDTQVLMVQFGPGNAAKVASEAGLATKVTSAIGGDPFLSRAAEQAGKSEVVQRDLDSLVRRASANVKSGMGTKALEGTDIHYLRVRNGARLFYRIVDGGIQIVAKASKANESQVIDRLKALYGK
jgi:hypothetical protein